MRTWKPVDHVCKSCGGRILQCVSGAGMTAGGNPVFMCADCEKTQSGVGPDVLCWCGYSHRRMHPATAYRCAHMSLAKDNQKMLNAFRACGYEPSRGGVGIMLESDYYAAKGE